MDSPSSETPVSTPAASTPPSTPDGASSASAPVASESHLLRWILIGGSLVVVVVAAIFFSSGKGFKGSFVDTGATPVTGEIQPTGEIKPSASSDSTPSTSEMPPPSSSFGGTPPPPLSMNQVAMLQLIPPNAAPGSEFHGILTGLNFGMMLSDFAIKFKDDTHIKVVSQELYGDKILKFTAKIAEDTPEGPSDVSLSVTSSANASSNNANPPPPPGASSPPLVMSFSMASMPLVISKAPQAVVPSGTLKVASVIPNVLSNNVAFTVTGGDFSGAKVSFDDSGIILVGEPIVSDGHDYMVFAVNIKDYSVLNKKNTMTITGSAGASASYVFEPAPPSTMTVMDTTDTTKTSMATPATSTTPAPSTNTPAPTVTKIDPGLSAPGSSILVAITGTNLLNTDLSFSDTDLSVDTGAAVPVFAADKVMFTIKIKTDAKQEVKKIFVTTKDGKSKAEVNFTVVPAPALVPTTAMAAPIATTATAVTPNVVAQGDKDVSVKITGTNLKDTKVVADGNTNVVIKTSTIAADGNSIDLKIDVPDAAKVTTATVPTNLVVLPKTGAAIKLPFTINAKSAAAVPATTPATTTAAAPGYVLLGGGCNPPTPGEKNKIATMIYSKPYSSKDAKTGKEYNFPEQPAFSTLSFFSISQSPKVNIIGPKNVKDVQLVKQSEGVGVMSFCVSRFTLPGDVKVGLPLGKYNATISDLGPNVDPPDDASQKTAEFTISPASTTTSTTTSTATTPAPATTSTPQQVANKAPAKPSAITFKQDGKVVTDSTKLDATKDIRVEWTPGVDDTIMQSTDKPTGSNKFGAITKVNYRLVVKNTTDNKVALEVPWETGLVSGNGGDIGKTCIVQLYRDGKKSSASNWICPYINIASKDLLPGKSYSFVVEEGDGILGSGETNVTFKTTSSPTKKSAPTPKPIPLINVPSFNFSLPSVPSRPR